MITRRLSNLAGIMAYEYVHRHITTNADRIRAMSDEELANIITADWCELLNCDSPCDEYCDLKVLDWLRQEVDDGDS